MTDAVAQWRAWHTGPIYIDLTCLSTKWRFMAQMWDPFISAIISQEHTFLADCYVKERYKVCTHRWYTVFCPLICVTMETDVMLETNAELNFLEDTACKLDLELWNSYSQRYSEIFSEIWWWCVCVYFFIQFVKF